MPILFVRSITPNRHEVEFRYDPVPYTGRRNRSMANMRAVRTQAERREACSDRSQGYVRASRSMANLPTWYDDLGRSVSRSWKETGRKHQWK